MTSDAYWPMNLLYDNRNECLFAGERCFLSVFSVPTKRNKTENLGVALQIILC